MLTPRDPEAGPVIRHSAEHVLADAVERLFPGTIIDAGRQDHAEKFQYDFRFPRGFTPEDLERIEAEISAGNSIYDAFCAAGCFPVDFLDTLLVGEQSGGLVESMARLAVQCLIEDRSGMTPPHASHRILLEPHLVVRRSTDPSAAVQGPMYCRG